MNILFKKVARYILPFWKGLLVIMIFTTFQSSIASFIPYLSKPLIDSGYANRDIKTIIVLAVIGGAMFIITTLISFLQRYINENVKKNLLLRLGEDYSRSLYSLSLDSFRIKSAGERAYLLNTDVENISDLLISRLPQALGVLIKMILYFAITFSLNRSFSLLLFLFTPPLIIMSRIFSRVQRSNYSELMRLSQKMNQKIYESFSKIYLVKAFGAEEYEKRRYMDLLRERLTINLKSLRFSFLSGLAGSLFNKIAAAAVGILGIFLVTKKAMTLGDLSAFLVYYGLFLGTVSQTLNFFERLAIDKMHIRNFFEVLESKGGIKDSPGSIYIPHLKGTIELKNIDFAYKADKPVLINFSLCIEPAIWSAIIGPSGCGKTTILNLVMRLYEINRGGLFIDGHNIKDIKIASLRKNITIATQDVLFFTDTIKNNVLYGIDPKAYARAESDLAEVLEIACINDFLIELPLKYDTVLGDNAFNVSQGQRQRLAIARALARQPNILILDEALSSVDVDTEKRLYDNIKSYRKNLTTIIVSHRPSTVRQADIIYKMDFGSRIEEVEEKELTNIGRYVNINTKVEGR